MAARKVGDQETGGGFIFRWDGVGKYGRLTGTVWRDNTEQEFNGQPEALIREGMLPDTVFVSGIEPGASGQTFDTMQMAAGWVWGYYNGRGDAEREFTGPSGEVAVDASQPAQEFRDKVARTLYDMARADDFELLLPETQAAVHRALEAVEDESNSLIVPEDPESETPEQRSARFQAMGAEMARQPISSETLAKMNQVYAEWDEANKAARKQAEDNR
jgi:hypothetical protein